MYSQWHAPTRRQVILADARQELSVFRALSINEATVGSNSAAQPDQAARVIKRLSSGRAISVSKTRCSRHLKNGWVDETACVEHFSTLKFASALSPKAIFISPSR